MPQLIRTPEDIFRAEKRDIYALHWLADRDDIEWISASVFQDVWAEMVQWFAQHMPDSPTEFMASSEHSGIIAGGPVSLRVAFSDPDLARFCQIWETPDGKSIDPRFQCYQHTYQHWWKKRGHFVPTFEQPQAPGVSVWIETPLGILSHVLTEGEGGSDIHPSNERNLWANACAQWPQLQAYSLDDMNFGEVIRRPGNNSWCLLWCESVEFMRKHDDAGRERHWRTVADWLRLPPEADIASIY